MHPTCGARLHQPYGMVGCRGFMHGAAVGQHQEKVVLYAQTLQSARQALEIATKNGQHISVANGRGGTLVFADLRHHVAGDTDHQIRCFGFQDLAHPTLVDRIAKAVQE